MCNQWKVREQLRLDDGTYKRVPWHHEGWWRDAVNSDTHPARDHFAHVSTGEDKALVAFTENDARGHADRQTRCKPGRYLTRFFSDTLTADQIRTWAGTYAYENEPLTVKFANDADEIERVYEDGPHSCMAGPAAGFDSSIHPTRVYAAGDLAVAYLECDGKVTARAICWPEKKLRGRVYGDYLRLTPLLVAAGFAVGSMTGAKLCRIPEWDGFVMPYLDGCQSVRDCGDHLQIHADGDIGAGNQNGLTDIGCECDGCGERCGEEDLHSSDHYDGLRCESCENEIVSYCEECEECEECKESCHRDDMYNVDDKYMCESCRDKDYTECVFCGDYHKNAYVTTDDDDDTCCECCREIGRGVWGTDDERAPRAYVAPPTSPTIHDRNQLSLAL